MKLTSIPVQMNSGGMIHVQGIQLSTHLAAIGERSTDLKSLRGRWMLTHIQSGCAVGVHRPCKLADAKAAAEHLESLMDWDFTSIEQFLAGPRGPQRAVRDYMRRHAR